MVHLQITYSKRKKHLPSTSILFVLQKMVNFRWMDPRALQNMAGVFCLFFTWGPVSSARWKNTNGTGPVMVRPRHLKRTKTGGDEGEEIWLQNLSGWVRNDIEYYINLIRSEREIVQNLVSFYMGLSFSWNEVLLLQISTFIGSHGLCKPFGLRWFLKVFPTHPTSSFLTVTDSQEVLTVVKNMDTKAVERCRQLHDLSSLKKPGNYRGGGNSNIGVIFTPIPGEMVQFGLIFFYSGLVQPPTTGRNHIWFAHGLSSQFETCKFAFFFKFPCCIAP